MPNARSTRELDLLVKACNDLTGKAVGLSRDYKGIPTRADIKRAIDQIQLAIGFLDREIGDPIPTLPGGIKRVVSGLASRLLNSDEQDTQAPTEDEAVQRVALSPTRQVPMTGNTESIPLPGLLFFLQEHGKTGTLNIVTEAEVFTLEVEAGELIHASSDNSPEGCRLGEILVQQGSIVGKNLQTLLTKYARMPGRLGTALTRGEIVTRDQLRKALEHQIQELFDRLLNAKNAYFHFTDGKTDSADGNVRMNVTKLLMETVRRQDGK